MRRLIVSPIVRMVLVVFLIQFLTTAGALWLVQSRMHGILLANHSRTILDARNELLETYRAGGVGALRKALDDPAGAMSDPLMFAQLDQGGQSDTYNLKAITVPPPSVRPVRVSYVDSQANTRDGIALTSALGRTGRLVIGSRDNDGGIASAFYEAAALTLALTGLLAVMAALGLGYFVNRRTRSIADTARALASGNFAARVAHPGYRDGFDELREQLNAMAERIAHLLEELNTISTSLAHDLRSPVARMRASLDQAMRLAGKDRDEVADALELARTDADTLERMLTGALDLNRLQSGAILIGHERIDLAGIVTDLSELYEALAENRKVALATDIAQGTVMGDRELLARAVSNLVENALKHGATLVSCHCATGGGEVRVAISDNGTGIAPEDRARAMQRFVRIDNARSSPGTGLGLAVTAAIASLHGGRLELRDSDLPGGSGLCAVLILPAAQ